MDPGHSVLMFSLFVDWITECLGTYLYPHIYIIMPGGSYTTVKYWLHNNSSTEMICPISADVITFFDNSQMLGRNWRVVFDCKAMISCITSMIHISSNTSSTFQIHNCVRTCG